MTMTMMTMMTMVMTIVTMLFVNVCGNKRLIAGPLWNYNVAVGFSQQADRGRTIKLKCRSVSFPLKSDDCQFFGEKLGVMIVLADDGHHCSDVGRWWWSVRMKVSDSQEHRDYSQNIFSRLFWELIFSFFRLCYFDVTAHTYNLCWIEQKLVSAFCSV